MKPFFRIAIWFLIPLFGILFVYRLTQIPSRQETAFFLIVFFVIPTLKYPRFGVYYLLSVPLFIPLLRRIYYLLSERPEVDFLMLIGDGVMVGFVTALLVGAVLKKERIHDRLTLWIIIYDLLLFIKIFFLNQGSIVEGLYGYKFNGLFVLFFFASSYVLDSLVSLRRALNFSAWALLITALHGTNQFFFGFTGFEQKWLDSITFTTLRIEGIVRPFSTYVSPAAMADGMSILILIGSFYIARPLFATKAKGLLWTGVAVLPLLIATVRTSWAATVAGLLFFWIFLRLRQGWIRWVLLLIVTVAIVGLVTRSDSTADSQNTTLASNLRGDSKKVTSILITNRTQALANPLQEYSIQKRMQIWTEIWYFAIRNPLGRGQGTHGYAHSYYFQVLGEIGFLGLFAFLIILFLSFKKGFQIIQGAQDPEIADLARFSMSLIFIFCILNITGTHLHSNPGDVFFWFTVGILSRLHSLTFPAPKSPLSKSAS